MTASASWALVETRQACAETAPLNSFSGQGTIIKMEIKRKESLKNFTSWQIGGFAEYFCLPTNMEEIRQAVQFALKQQLPVHILSGGSNVLVSDEGLDGLTICLKYFSSYKVQVVEGDFVVDCYAGMPKSELLKVYLKQQLKPALFLAGIPGDVGGGVVMNAGVSENIQPREFCEIVDSFDVLKWNQNTFWIENFSKDKVQWSYRHCRGWQEGIIVQVKLKCPYQPDPTILEQVRAANKIRLLKQPLDKPSCGSVFMNPEGHKAAQLIDSSGLKGLQRGNAQVSIKHANFIVNLGDAKASDVWGLICEVQKNVLEKHGVSLKTEVVRLGKWRSS